MLLRSAWEVVGLPSTNDCPDNALSVHRTLQHKHKSLRSYGDLNFALQATSAPSPPVARVTSQVAIVNAPNATVRQNCIVA